MTDRNLCTHNLTNTHTHAYILHTHTHTHTHTHQTNLLGYWLHVNVITVLVTPVVKSALTLLIRPNFGLVTVGQGWATHVGGGEDHVLLVRQRENVAPVRVKPGERSMN